MENWVRSHMACSSRGCVVAAAQLWRLPSLSLKMLRPEARGVCALSYSDLLIFSWLCAGTLQTYVDTAALGAQSGDTEAGIVSLGLVPVLLNLSRVANVSAQPLPLFWDYYQFKLSTAEPQQGSSSSLVYLINECLQNLIMGMHGMEAPMWHKNTHMALHLTVQSGIFALTLQHIL